MHNKDITWVIEKGIFDENLEKLQYEVTRRGMNFIIFEKKDIFDNPAQVICEESCTLFYGSLNSTIVYQKSHYSSALPGTYCDLDKLKCTHYYPYFGTHLTNSDGFFLPFGEIRRRKTELLKDGPIFIRPDSAFKVFTGDIFSLEKWDR